MKSFAIFASIWPLLAWSQTVHYDLTARRQRLDMSGRGPVDFPIAINGSVPAPTLEFTEGDQAEIVVKNDLPDEELSVHWHGLLLPNPMDGVPYVTTPSIHSGESLTYRFPLRQSGTYWYHSHTEYQEQQGVYGAIVIKPKKEVFAAAKDVVAVISDWSDEPGATIIRNLRKDGDYYLYKKGTMRSYWGALKENSLGNFLSNEWIRMGGMDLSDVGYDAFLINGRRESQLVAAKKGETVRVRLINAGASSYFHVGLAGLPFRVIAADGLPVVPIDAREILMGMAETYDLVFQLPDQLSYELRATAQDGTGFASAWIGDGEKRPAPDRAPPSLYEKMEHGHHGGHGGGSKGEYGAHGGVPSHGEHTTHAEHASHAQHMGHGPDSAMGPVTVDRLENPAPSQFPADSHFTELKLVLNGDMFRYIWHINGRAIFEERNIEVKEGDVVRFIFENQSMMHHPMHLHGHFFRVVTEAGPTSPIKHTVDVPPHGTRVIEFRANEPGLWMLHCHNLYHMHSGMARVVKYMSYEPRTEVLQHAAHDPHNHDHLYTMGSLEGASNHAQLHYRISSTWNEMELRLEARERSGWDGEGDLFLRRWIGNYLSFFAGATTVDRTFRGLLGVSYLLPFLLKTQLSIDTQGEFRLDLARKFQWTSTIFTEVDVTLRQTLESEFEVSLLYGPVWWWAAGLMVTESSVGAGARIQF